MISTSPMDVGHDRRSRESLRGGFDLINYSRYVKNNPVNAVDPSGLGDEFPLVQYQNQQWTMTISCKRREWFRHCGRRSGDEEDLSRVRQQIPVGHLASQII